jgi:YVTN family beta-propeller protein
VSVIDLNTNQVVGSPIEVGDPIKYTGAGDNGYGPYGIAINPEGTFAYVTNINDNSVSRIDLNTNQVVGDLIEVGAFPTAIAIHPDGAFAYVVNFGGNTVSVIDLTTNQTLGTPIGVGAGPFFGLALNATCTFAYVTNYVDNSVSVIALDTPECEPKDSSVSSEPELSDPESGPSGPSETEGNEVEESGTPAAGTDDSDAQSVVTEVDATKDELAATGLSASHTWLLLGLTGAFVVAGGGLLMRARIAAL